MVTELFLFNLHSVLLGINYLVRLFDLNILLLYKLSHISFPSATSFQCYPVLIDNLLVIFCALLLCHILCSTAARLTYSHSSSTVPIWSCELSSAQKATREVCHAWVAAGRPRDLNNPFRRTYKSRKPIFRPCFVLIVVANVIILYLS